MYYPYWIHSARFLSNFGQYQLSKMNDFFGCWRWSNILILPIWMPILLVWMMITLVLWLILFQTMQGILEEAHYFLESLAAHADVITLLYGSFKNRLWAYFCSKHARCFGSFRGKTNLYHKPSNNNTMITITNRNHCRYCIRSNRFMKLIEFNTNWF